MFIQKVEENICNVVGIEEFVFVYFIVLVRFKFEGREVFIFVMFNVCSIRLFVFSDIMVMLKVNGMEMQLMVKIIKSVKLYNFKVLNGLVVIDLNGDYFVQLLKIFIKEDFFMFENIFIFEFVYYREIFQKYIGRFIFIVV